MADPTRRYEGFGHYDVFGLCVASEIALPELAGSQSDGQPDVEIRLGSVPSHSRDKPGLSIFPDGALLRIPEVGGYWMSGGRELVVEPDPGASEACRIFFHP